MESKSGENFLSLQCKDKGEGGGHMFVLVTEYTLRKIIANDQGIVAVTGRAHCQRQVAFLIYSKISRVQVANGNVG